MSYYLHHVKVSEFFFNELYFMVDIHNMINMKRNIDIVDNSTYLLTLNVIFIKVLGRPPSQFELLLVEQFDLLLVEQFELLLVEQFDLLLVE